MKFIIVGRNIEVTPGLRAAVEEKIGKLDKYFNPDTEVHVTLSVEKDRQKIEEDGNVVMETNADDDDIYYDEVSSGLLIAEIRRSRQELFESLSLYYRVFIKKEDVSELLDEEDGE